MAAEKCQFAQATLRSADAVCFDVDSTVITKEGIDELAEFLGVGEKVAELTHAAMEGGMPFHEALAARLAIMQPTRSRLDEMLALNPPEELLSPGVAAFVHQLQTAGKRVFLVSGGFRQMIEPIAKAINVPKEDIYANAFVFNESGDFTGHDPDEPTSRAGGKAKVVAQLKAAHGFKTVVMIGDGATDMEAREVEGGADAFIGYGGVAVRDKVKAGADWFVYDFAEMSSVLSED